jgi:hypothetical protein
MRNNYLMSTPLTHIDQFDLDALRRWKVKLLGFPKWMQSKDQIKQLTVRILEIEIYLEAHPDGQDTPPQST